MTKNLFSMLRYTVIVTLIASLFVISGCDDDEGPVVFNGTLLDFIKSDEFKQATNSNEDLALDSLVKYISLYPDLTGLISSTSEYTLFAPSNKAFKNLLALPGFPAKISLINPDIIKGVLAYHVIDGKKLTGDLTAGTKFNTKYTDATSGAVQVIEINSDGTTLKTGSTNTAIKITEGGKDRQASNGVIHITESVLIPPTIGASLTPLLGTIAGSVLLGADFTYLAKMIGNADKDVPAEQKLYYLLSRPNPPVFPTEASSTVRRTFFAPPNAVFQAAATTAGVTVDQFIASFGQGSTSSARAILLNHLVTSDSKKVYTVTDVTGSDDIQFSQQLQLTTNAGKKLTVLITDKSTNPATFNPNGVVITAPKGTDPVGYKAPIVGEKSKGTLDIVATNGILQIVGGILVPQ